MAKSTWSTEDRETQHQTLAKYKDLGIFPTYHEIARSSGNSYSNVTMFMAGNAMTKSLCDHFTMIFQDKYGPNRAKWPQDLQDLVVIWAKNE